MAVKTKKIVSKVPSKQWNVRDENGGIFGPVDFHTLKEWVMDGRVSPLSEISGDEGENWIPAVGIAELEMDCVAEIEPGSFYGPIHRKAMDELLKDGSISSEAVLYYRSDLSKASDPLISSSSELIPATDKIVSSESENSVLSEEDRIRINEYEKLNAQVASLCSEREELRAANDRIITESNRLQSLIDELRGNLDQVLSERDSLLHESESFQLEKRSAAQDYEEFEQKIARIKMDSDQIRADLQTRIDTLGEKNRELNSENSVLKDESIGLRSEIASLSEQNQNLNSQNSAFKDEVERLNSDVCALNEQNQDLNSKCAVLTEETESLRSEFDVFRKNSNEQQKLMDERELLHAAELKEREASFNLQVKNLEMEHENTINGIRQENLQIQRPLLDEVRALQDELKSLQKLNMVISQEKETLGTRIQQLDRKCERTHDESQIELDAKERRIKELASEIEDLLAEIAEMRGLNEKLKTEFVAFEEQKTGEETAQQSRRKLIVLKQLFVEAAGLLQDVDDNADIMIEDLSTSSVADDTGNTELLEFEEVEPHETVQSGKKGVEQNDGADAASKDDRVEVIQQTAERGQSGKQSKKKNSKKWLFGTGEKKLDHKSLAELEAQARIELQRLSSQGGNISALFDKNK